jgi:hypothetical protein
MDVDALQWPAIVIGDDPADRLGSGGGMMMGSVHAMTAIARKLACTGCAPETGYRRRLLAGRSSRARLGVARPMWRDDRPSGLGGIHVPASFSRKLELPPIKPCGDNASPESIVR